MAVWVVRGGRKGEFEELALAQGVVVLGQGLSDLSTARTRGEMTEVCCRHLPDTGLHTIWNWVGQYWHFINDIEVGDLVVMPIKRQLWVTVGRIGPYQHRPDLPSGPYQARCVKWIKTAVPRSALDPEMNSALRSPKTVFRIRQDHAEERVLHAAGL